MSDTKKYPILVSIPHASTFVPAELRRLMLISDKEIKSHSDLYTDDIFHLPKCYIVKAKISRLVVDPNRAPDDIEMECKLCHDGVVVSVSENGNQIYKTPPSVDSIFQRVRKYHDTFHAEIDALMPHVKFLIDGHSMAHLGPVTKHDAGAPRPDIALGNRNYTTCSREMTLRIFEFFENEGLSVKINDPYEGKYVVGYHCSRKTVPGIQIEFNRRLFMNEKTLMPKKTGIKKMNALMKKLVTGLDQDILRRERLKT